MVNVDTEGIALLREWAAAWSSHDLDRVASLFTDDCIYEDVTMNVVNRGKDQLKAFGAAFFAALPDFRIELTEFFTSGDRGSMEWVMSGTHRGDLPGIPATGEPVSLRGCTICELRGGKIRRNSDYWDMATFLKQIGHMS
jgi:steroid delta-isomerase-like uncharacterized protein